MLSLNRMYVLEDAKIRVVVDPACGGKIRSLVSKATGKEYLYQDARTELSNTGYSSHDISGMDECFPTVGPCHYEGGHWNGLSLGDHGWLWDRAWSVESTADSLRMGVELVDGPFTFWRSMRLSGPGELLLEYSIVSRAAEPFEFLYANHLMLSADTTTQIVYPAEMRRAYVSANYYHDRLAVGSWVDWPPPQALGLTSIDPGRGTLVKLFSPRLTSGETAISHGDGEESLRIAFDSVRLPYLGVLIAQGFNPLERDGQGAFIGLEATTGIGDDLAQCRGTGTTNYLQPGETRRFQILLSIIGETSTRSR